MLVYKPWLLKVTCPRLAQRMSTRCSGDHPHQHVIGGGMPSRSSILSPDAMCKRFAQHIMEPPTADLFFADLGFAGKAEPEREEEIMANESSTDDPSWSRSC